MDNKNTSKHRIINPVNKTKKKQTPQLTASEKSKLWNLLDDEKGTVKNVPDMECVYQSQTTNACLTCESPLVTMEDGFPTCSNNECGRFYRDVLDFSPEWRYYGADDKNSNDPTRCGNPINPLLQESSHGCKVLYNNKSSYEMRRIGRWTEWQSIPHREKSLYNEFMHITTMAQNGGISKICVDEALVIHKDISEQKMFRGCNRAGTIAASIYIACRLNDCPRTAHELAEIFHLDKTSATNGCSLALDMLNNVDRNHGGSEEQSALNSTSPKDFIERYCSRLNMSKQQIMLAMFIAKKVESNNLIPDNTPNSIAAGIVYFTCHVFELNRSKTEIKSICGVSEVTINKCFKKLEMIKEQIVPSCFMGATV
jgi:transcription initiation factor TFIIB